MNRCIIVESLLKNSNTETFEDDAGSVPEEKEGGHVVTKIGYCIRCSYKTERLKSVSV